MKLNKVILITTSLMLIQSVRSVIITTAPTQPTATNTGGTNLITTPTAPAATTLTLTTTPVPSINTSTVGAMTDTTITGTPLTTSVASIPTTASSASTITSGIISNTPVTTSTNSTVTPVTTANTTSSNLETTIKKNVLDADLNSKEINKNAPVISIKVGENYTFNGPTDAQIFPDQEMLDTKKTTQKLDSIAISSVSSNSQHTITVTGVRESRPDEEPYPIIVKKDGVHTTIARVRVVEK